MSYPAFLRLGRTRKRVAHDLLHRFQLDIRVHDFARGQLKKSILTCSLIFNLAILGFYKYEESLA